jgi:outer membrane protein TolC
MRKLNRSIIRQGSMCFLFCFISLSTLAQQDTIYLNLGRLLDVGGAGNLTIEQYKKVHALAIADLAEAKEWWLPDVYAGFQTHKLWGAAMNTDGRFFLDVNRGNMAAGFELDAHWDFGEGIYKAKAAGIRAEASIYQSQAARNKVLLNTIHAYYDFLTAQLYSDAYEEMAGQADTIVEQLQIQVEAGMRFQSEMLLAKSNHNHLQVKRLEALYDYRKAAASLANLLNLPAGTGIIGLDMLAPLNIIAEAEWKQNLQDSIYQNRPEYSFLQAGLEATRVEKKSTTTGLWLPEARIGVNTDHYGGLFEQVRPMRPDEHTNPRILYPTSAINASLMWRIPLGRLTYSGRLKQYNAQIDLRENEIRQFRNQVNEEVGKAKAQLLMASEQLELAEESQALAKKAVEQSIQRQQLGTAKPFEVFQAQEFYLRARLDYLKAITDYNKGQYSLYVALGNNL